MRRRWALTLIEVLAVIAILLLLTGILMPLVRSPRRAAQAVKVSSQLGDIHRGMLLYAQENNAFLPGIGKDGSLVEAGVEKRFGVLLETGLVSPEMLISPQEAKKSKWTSGEVTTSHYSFAMLQIDNEGERHNAWRSDADARSVMVSDRNTGSSGDSKAVRSLYTTKPGVWQGELVWGDNHTEFIKTCQVDTRYGTVATTSDNLFAVTGGDDAYMIYSGE